MGKNRGWMMSDEFDGLVAAVTGGSSGIGAAIADVLADRGAKVGVLDLNPPSGQVERLFLRADVTDDGSVRTAIAGIV